MYSINDIADYIILRLKTGEDSILIINLKLQKLLYYVQAWSLGINRQAMFDGDFQAWVHGPVNREIYERFKSKNIYSEITIEDVINKDVFNTVSEDDQEFINFILENYQRFSGAELERMTHLERPWIEARSGIGPFECCENIISQDTMMEYYGERWEKTNC